MINLSVDPVSFLVMQFYLYFFIDITSSIQGSNSANMCFLKDDILKDDVCSVIPDIDIESHVFR